VACRDIKTIKKYQAEIESYTDFSVATCILEGPGAEFGILLHPKNGKQSDDKKDAVDQEEFLTFVQKLCSNCLRHVYIATKVQEND